MCTDMLMLLLRTSTSIRCTGLNLQVLAVHLLLQEASMILQSSRKRRYSICSILALPAGLFLFALGAVVIGLSPVVQQWLMLDEKRFY